jgi:hypothetical protein
MIALQTLAIASLLLPLTPTPVVSAPPAAAQEGAGEKATPGTQAGTKESERVEEGFGAVRTPEIVQRIGGDREVSIEIRGGVFYCGPSSIESPLPDGYPEPTPPGAIDIKTYPSVRRAEFRQESARGMTARMNVGFWPLFNHISRNDIPMTSPVEIEYSGVYNDLTTLEPTADGAWTMSFLYRVKSMGPIGQDGPVKIVDTPEVTVVSTAVRGPYGMSVTRDGMKVLKEWLDGQQEWEVAGSPRVFHYNGPSVRDRNKWSEVQIPIRKREQATAAAVPPASTSAESASPANR